MSHEPPRGLDPHGVNGLPDFYQLFRYVPLFVYESFLSMVYKIANPSWLWLESPDGNHHFVKASVRGNDVYSRRVRSRFHALEVMLRSSGLPLHFPHGISSCLFFTLTYDNPDIDSTWRHGSADLNLFRSRLVREFGDCLLLARVFESHRDGRLHIHGLALFLSYRFPYFVHISKKTGKKSYRITEVDSFKRCWVHGFSDVSACSSVRAGLQYISKYMAKAISYDDILGMEPSDMEKGFFTLAFNRAYRKRAFSISRDLRNRLTDGVIDLNSSLHISNSNTPKWILRGFISPLFRSGLGVLPARFSLPSLISGSPPPDISDFLKHFLVHLRGSVVLSRPDDVPCSFDEQRRISEVRASGGELY